MPRTFLEALQGVDIAYTLVNNYMPNNRTFAPNLDGGHHSNTDDSHQLTNVSGSLSDIIIPLMHLGFSIKLDNSNYLV